MAINFLDILIILVYFFGLIAIGVIVSRRIKTHEDSMVAGRSFGSFLAGVGKAANLAGGSTSVGGTGYGYTYGVSGSWFGIANIILGLVLAPIAPRIWRAMMRGGFTSVGEYLGYRFGKFAQVFAGFLNTCAFIGFVSAQIVATATIMMVLFGWDYTFSAIVSTCIVIIYTILGGLKAVVYTDCMQMAIIYLGIVIILPIVAVNTVGGLGEVFASVPESMKEIGSMGWWQIIGVILVPTITAPFTIQSTYTYTAACKSANTARNANLWGSLFYALPAFAVILIGLCCYIMYPDLASDQDALPTIVVDLLPNGLIGVLLAAVLSATMSTSSTGLLCAVNCFTSDVVFVIKDAISNRDKSKSEGHKIEKKEVLTLKATRIIIGCVGVFTLIGSLYFPHIIELILMGYSLLCGGLLVPALAAMFSKRATKPAAIASMLTGGISFLIFSFTVSWPAIFGATPISALTMIVVSLCTKKPDPLTYDLYFEDEWEKSPNNPDRKTEAAAE